MIGEGPSEQGSNDARDREDSSEGTEQLWSVFELCDVSDDGQAGRAVVLYVRKASRQASVRTKSLLPHIRQRLVRKLGILP